MPLAVAMPLAASVFSLLPPFKDTRGIGFGIAIGCIGSIAMGCSFAHLPICIVIFNQVCS